MAAFTQDLVVIEAVGKLRQLHAVLDRIGVRARCIATLGHVWESPPHLQPLAIRRLPDGQYEETQRIPARPAAFERLADELRRLRGRLLIATDDDQEGEAIAADVMLLASRLRPEVVPLRVRAAALTDAEWRTALALALPVAPVDAFPAAARRIADRVLAAAYSRPAEGVIVGRIAAGIAGLARDGGLPTHAVTLTVSADDGRGPFSAHTFVRSREQADALQADSSRTAALIPAGPAEVQALGAAPTYSDYLCAMGESGRMSLSEASALLQGLYESGVVSYPRTAGQHYRTATRQSIGRFAQTLGMRASASPLPAPVGGGHEPLHIVDEKVLAGVDVLRPLTLQRDPRQTALAWLSRQMVQSVTQIQRQFADTRGLSPRLQSLTWSRTLGQMPPWWQRPKAAVRELTLEQSVLHGMLRSGLGRPSTYVGHVVRSIERGLVGAGAIPGPECARVLSACPSPLALPAVGRELERMCQDAGQQGVGPAVDRVLGLAVGAEPAALERLAALLHAPGIEEPVYAPTP